MQEAKAIVIRITPLDPKIVRIEGLGLIILTT
jgi:hypothetical protein